MTVPSEQSRIQYTTDGTSVSFPVPFRFLNAAHLQVARQHDDEASTLELGVDYSVSGVGNQAGGTITTTTTLPAGDSISIERVVPITQETAYQRNDPFPERAHEQALDKLTMICQMLGGVLGLTPGSVNRALLLGAADTDGKGSYRANGNRISNLGAPKSTTDAARLQDIIDRLSDLAADGSGQFVVERLADTNDPSNGSGMIGFIQRGDGAIPRTSLDKSRENVTPEDFSGNNNTALQKALALGGTVTANKQYIIDTSTAEIDTSQLRGDGSLVNGWGDEFPSLYWKGKNVYKDVMTLEDEFSPHTNIDGEEMSYTAFSSSILFRGAEITVARCGYAHARVEGKKSAVVLYRVVPGREPCVEKKVIYTTESGGDVRDLNITRMANRSDSAFVTFSELKASGIVTKLLILNLNGLEAYSVHNLPSMNGYFKWGNVLQDPVTRHLIMTSYQNSGNKIQIWRSALPFTDISEAPTMQIAAEIGETTNCQEPSICYWKNRLVLAYRKNGEPSKYTFTYDLSGASGWFPTVNFSENRWVYAPAMPAYITEGPLTIVGVLGNARNTLVSVSTGDLRSWETQAFQRVAGWPLTIRGTNGYPSICDLGGAYSITTFSDALIRGEPEAMRTRLERRVIEKKFIDVAPDSPSYAEVQEMQNIRYSGYMGASMVGNSSLNLEQMAVNGNGWRSTFHVKRDLAIAGVIIYCRSSGASKSGIRVAIYKDGVQLALSDAITVDGNFSLKNFPFSPRPTLPTGSEYQIRVVDSSGPDTIVIYGHRGRRSNLAVYDFQDAVFLNTLSSAGGDASRNIMFLPLISF